MGSFTVKPADDHNIGPLQESSVGDNHSPDGKKPEYIIAIGGSAGGFEAFERFFAGIPPNTGMAFVVIQHLDPTHTSLLSELLQRSTAMPVNEASDQMQVMPDTIYVIPQNTSLSIHDGRLQLSKLSAPRGTNMPVDLFFESLAIEQGTRSIGIIVSGMGTDGTLGLKAIKEVSGVVMVQDPDSAKFDGMPRSAVNTGQVDYIAPIDELPAKLIAYITHSSGLHQSEDEIEQTHKGELQKILQLIRTRTRHDFTLYKKSTLYRRIAKRAGLLQISGISEYARYMEEHPQEVDILFKEFLIGVTRFFRDSEAFDYLKGSVLPELINSLPGDSAVRVWVAGCSTGEEAYSLAIIIREVIDDLRPDAGLQIQIFATDIDEQAITTARKGVYPPNIAADVSSDRLRRFFMETDDGFLVSKIIREMVVFALHDLTRDPPFTRMDIVSCRNMMIYFSPELQKKVIPLLHYALNPGGILFLGTVESTYTFPDLFTTVDARWRVYKPKESTIPTRLVDVPAYQPFIETYGEKNVSDQSTPAVSETVRRVLLERYAPAAVIIDENGYIIYISGRTGKYLEPAEGGTNWNITAMAREGLRPELPNAIYRAFSRQADVLLKELKIKTNGHYETVNVTISPFIQPDSMNGLLMVVFEDVILPEKPEGTDAVEESASDSHARLLLTEKELATTKENLQNIIEEMEATQEELRSTNEEYQSTNEELQSTNEELITSKEELQSLNEELVTLNNELQTRVDDLTMLNNDMVNLMNSTQIATIFLDLKLMIRRFTPAVVGLFKLRTVDIGRPITDITQRLQYASIEADLKVVLDTLTTIEQEIEDNDGRWFIMRIMPYRTLDNHIAGIVITFSDVTLMKQLEGDLRKSYDLSRSLNEISAEISASLDSEPVMPIVVKKASEAIGVDAAMITVIAGTGRVVRQAFGLESMQPKMPITDEDAPYLKSVEETMRPIAIRDIEVDGGVSAGFVATYGIKSVLGIPLVAGGEFAGVLSLIATSTPRKFAASDIEFANKLGIAVSLALNNIRIFKAALIAKNEAEEAQHKLQEHHDMLQQALLPTDMYVTPGYELATRFIPGAAGKFIGGDFYDVFKTEDGKTAFLVGDVTGKGVEAASLAVAVRSTIRAFAYDLGEPDSALTHANAVTYSQSLYNERFATVFLAILDPQTGMFTYANAGHPPSMILRSDSTVELLDTGRLPIGIDSQIEYNLSKSQLLPGDKLIMYTDGISEARTGSHMLDIDGISAALERCRDCSPEKSLASLFEAALDFSDGELDDDAVVVIIGRTK